MALVVALGLAIGLVTVMFCVEAARHPWWARGVAGDTSAP
jgi:hypothetical protein